MKADFCDYAEENVRESLKCYLKPNTYWYLTRTIYVMFYLLFKATCSSEAWVSYIEMKLI